MEKLRLTGDDLSSEDVLERSKYQYNEELPTYNAGT
jgi:hypothetical protein